MRHPDKLLVRFKHVELVGVVFLNSRGKALVSKQPQTAWSGTYWRNCPGIVKVFVCNGGQKWREMIVARRSDCGGK